MRTMNVLTGFGGLCLALALAVTLSVAPASADDMPRCEAKNLGATACMENVLCECVHTRGGSITGQVSGAQWNCDALRPRCGTGASASDDSGVPGTVPYTQFPYPQSVGIDRSDETTIIQQNQTANPDNTNVNIND